MRLAYEVVKKDFEDGGCVLLSTTYVSSRDKLEYICECGRKSEISRDQLIAGRRCRGCMGSRISKTTLFPYEFVRESFEQAGCTLLSTKYEGSNKNLDYICECGNVSRIRFGELRRWRRCKECGYKKQSESMSGPKHFAYNHDKTDEERLNDRKYPEYVQWRKDVFTRDDYSCQCCGQVGGELNAHHIESFTRVKDLRIDVDNGITLCKDCHTEYHREFYHNDADSESFFEFMFGEYRDPWYAGETFED